jgi:hypothetical protein
MEFSENSRLKANVYVVNNLKIENAKLKWKCSVMKNSYFGNFDSLKYMVVGWGGSCGVVASISDSDCVKISDDPGHDLKFLPFCPS